MSTKTSIEWTDVTDNIITVKGGGWWCRKISAGCANCYAARINKAGLFGGNRLAYSGAVPDLLLREDIMAGWARQKRAKLHFVASMTDVFGEWVPREWQMKMLDAMAAARSQIFQVLTKRPMIMKAAAREWCQARGREVLPNNIWVGVSVEDQESADERCEWFRGVRAAYKFVSYEPAVGAVDWKGWDFVRQIISGGESGPGARPSHPDWHRATRDWCAANGVAYFFKQWGEWVPVCPVYGEDADLNEGDPDRQIGLETSGFIAMHEDCDHPANTQPCDPRAWILERVGKKAAGRRLAGRTHSEFPAMDHPALAGRVTR